MHRINYKRILLIRTDRLGDVVLTTPAIKALRKSYPDAYIAMMVRPCAELAVKGNPYLDEVIVYDKDKKHKSIISNIAFAMELKKRNFDIAIIFDPANRAHIIAYLAGIPKRIGYDEKLPFFLTDRIKNTKDEGKQHEVDYNLDMLKTIGVISEDRELYVPISSEQVEFIDVLLRGHNIEKGDKLITIHPGASCLSKIWPSERFAELADRLVQDYGVKIVVIGGDNTKDISCVNNVRKFMLKKGVFLAGGVNVGQLAALIKRSMSFVSNDSGPVHIAVAMKTPVVAIFGRNQPGLGPIRWGPIGPKDVVLHKDVGCSNLCLAHTCRRDFECLQAITVDDVFAAVDRIINLS